jgi:hypothetical protein
VRLDTVLTHAQHDRIALFQGRLQIAKAARLLRAPWAIVLGIKIEQDDFAFVILERVRLAVAVFQAKGGRFFLLDLPFIQSSLLAMFSVRTK